jgi:hypothetical protein
VLAAELRLKQKGTRPMDRLLAPLAVVVAALLAGSVALLKLRDKFFRR